MATFLGPHRTVAGITQLQNVGGFKEPLYQTCRVCYGKICHDECLRDNAGCRSIKCVQSVYQICLFFFWSGASEISYNNNKL